MVSALSGFNISEYGLSSLQFQDFGYVLSSLPFQDSGYILSSLWVQNFRIRFRI